MVALVMVPMRALRVVIVMRRRGRKVGGKIGIQSRAGFRAMPVMNGQFRADGRLDQRADNGLVHPGKDAPLGQIAAQIQFDTPSQITDVTPVARVIEEYDLIAVPADGPHQDLDGLIADWRENTPDVAWTGGGSFDQLVVTDLAMPCSAA